MSGEGNGKEKAVAVCDGCGQLMPVRVRESGAIHPIGNEEQCCATNSYRVLEADTQPGSAAVDWEE
ncbi:hypothetical protein [Halalkalicoccus tibetensis]